MFWTQFSARLVIRPWRGGGFREVLERRRGSVECGEQDKAGGDPDDASGDEYFAAAEAVGAYAGDRDGGAEDY
jgi:hypothetical protein